MITKEAFEDYKTKIRKEGRREGRIEKQKANLLKLISKKWPSLLPEAEAVIAALPEISTLESLFEALLDATSSDEALQALKQVRPSP